MQTISNENPELSSVLITLLRGVLYRDQDSRSWQSLLSFQKQVQDYLAVLGLRLMMDEAEGYAFLRQLPTSDNQNELPRLVARRPLSYPVSLLLVLLRRRLIELDSKEGETRLILDREDLITLVRGYLAQGTNEVRLLDRIERMIRNVVDLGFLRPLREEQTKFEVCRILKAFFDAQRLADVERLLIEYRSCQEATVGSQEAAG